MPHSFEVHQDVNTIFILCITTVNIHYLYLICIGLTAEEIEIAIDRSGTREDVIPATQPPPTANAVPLGVNQPPGGQMGKII